MLVLEELERAQARGAKIYAELAGYGVSSDAQHITEPDPTGEHPARAMKMALADAGIDASEIGYVNAHGTSTPLGDASETRVIKKALGEENARKTPISSTKGSTGHCLGAAGAVEAIFTVLALQEQMLPPTINYEHPDPECDLDYVPNDAPPGRAHGRDVELVRLRRPQRLDRPQALGRLDESLRPKVSRLVRSIHVRPLGDVRLLRHADRLERRDPPRARAHLRRGACRGAARRATTRSSRRSRRADPELSYREVLARALRPARRARRRNAVRSAARCRPGSRSPRCRPRSRRRRHAAGSSRSSRTPTATSSARRRRGSGSRSTRRSSPPRSAPTSRATATGRSSSRARMPTATATSTSPQATSTTSSRRPSSASRSVWINRLGESGDPPPTRELPDLNGLADVLDELVRRERRRLHPPPGRRPTTRPLRRSS